MFLLYRNTWPKKGLPDVAGSHMRLGVFVMPEDTREKVDQAGGGNHLQQDVVRVK